MASAEDVDTRVDFAGIQALSSRSAGYAVALKCLQVQADAEAHDPSLKNANGVKLHKDAWSWYTGALGEIEVGELLKALGPEWFVRHSVPIGAATKDVDHLVIGPGGVFAINTKHHRGASVWVGDHVLRVNNANTPHLRNAQNDARDVARRLTVKAGFPVLVTSVLAVLNATSIVDRRAQGAGRSPGLRRRREATHRLAGEATAIPQRHKAGFDQARRRGTRDLAHQSSSGRHPAGNAAVRATGRWGRDARIPHFASTASSRHTASHAFAHHETGARSERRTHEGDAG